MENKDSVIERLKKEILLLNDEIEHLQNLLMKTGIHFEKQETGHILLEETQDSIINDTGEKQPMNNGTIVTRVICNDTNAQQHVDISQGQRIIPEQITDQHAQYFYSFFKGRNDVYSKRSGKKNEKTGKTGYYTQCFNYWKDGICPKKDSKKVSVMSAQIRAIKN